jgi:hypothetical protein
LAFSSNTNPAEIRPALSSWATQLVGNQAHREVGKLTKNDPEDPEVCTQLRASTNGGTNKTRIAMWEDFGKFNLEGIGKKYKKRAPLTYFITESIAGPRDANGNVVLIL